VGTTGVFAGAVPNAPAGVGRSARRCGWRLRRNLRSARRCGWWLRGNLRVKDGWKLVQRRRPCDRRDGMSAHAVCGCGHDRRVGGWTGAGERPRSVPV